MSERNVIKPFKSLSIFVQESNFSILDVVRMYYSAIHSIVKRGSRFVQFPDVQDTIILEDTNADLFNMFKDALKGEPIGLTEADLIADMYSAGMFDVDQSKRGIYTDKAISVSIPTEDLLKSLKCDINSLLINYAYYTKENREAFKDFLFPYSIVQQLEIPRDRDEYLALGLEDESDALNYMEQNNRTFIIVEDGYYVRGKSDDFLYKIVVEKDHFLDNLIRDDDWALYTTYVQSIPQIGDICTIPLLALHGDINNRNTLETEKILKSINARNYQKYILDVKAPIRGF